MREIIVIMPEDPSSLLEEMLTSLLGGRCYRLIKTIPDLSDLRDKYIVFCIELDEIGTSNQMNNIIKELYKRDNQALKGSVGSLLIHCNCSLYTKTYAQDLVFLANNLGCRFVGRPLVEATKNLENFISMEKVFKMPLKDICIYQCQELGKRLFNEGPEVGSEKKKLLVLHSSNRTTSNTLSFYDMVLANLENIEVNEINLGNGNILDCHGCSYKTCKYLGQQSRCYYGGIIVEEVYPAILNTDSILFLCPNYNDMLTANIVATINRLTALYRKTKFYEKSIFSIIVSGYSGGDALAKQLISSLNMNKTFRLPPNFSVSITANHKGDVHRIPDIHTISKDFAKKINEGI